MASKKIKVGILFGGKSAEHEVSLQSAKNVMEAIDRNVYDVVLLGIDKQGHWLKPESAIALLNTTNHKLLGLNRESESVALLPQSSGTLTAFSDSASPGKVDVVFPILHGPFGEDGTVQGLLKLANVPFVGAGVLGSAVGMDKDVMKRLLRDAGLPVAKFQVIREGESFSFETATAQLGLPLFVKPANLGSSVGVSKVRNKQEFDAAVIEAFRYDRKILLEEFIEGREIECSVLGNDAPIASIPGEIVPTHEFYSYEAKYIDENGAALEVPAKISDEIRASVQELAVKVFKVLACEGLARVDFFLQKDGKLLVNEINTIPGFTKISMYPRLWEASGISYTELIHRLIELAIERFEKEQRLKTSRNE